MKRAMSMVLGVVLLCLVLGTGNLFADEDDFLGNYTLYPGTLTQYSLGKDINYLQASRTSFAAGGYKPQPFKFSVGFKYNYQVFPDDSRHITWGNGFGIVVIADLTPSSFKEKDLYLEGFTNLMYWETGDEVLAKGDLSGRLGGLSLLWGNHSPSSLVHTFYYGFGITLFNPAEFEPDAVEARVVLEDEIGPVDGFALVQGVSSAFGVHVKLGGEFTLSQNDTAFLYIDVIKTFVIAETTSYLWYQQGAFQDENEWDDKLNMSSFSLNIGLSFHF